MFDFGGGTFDVSVMEMSNGRFETRYIKGDANLGGRDLDILPHDYCAKEIKTRWNRDCLSNKPFISSSYLSLSNNTFYTLKY